MTTENDESFTETTTHLVCGCGQSATLVLIESGEKYLRHRVRYSVVGAHWANSRIMVDEPYDDDVLFEKLMLYCQQCGERLGPSNVVDFEI